MRLRFVFIGARCWQDKFLAMFLYLHAPWVFGSRIKNPPCGFCSDSLLTFGLGASEAARLVVCCWCFLVYVGSLGTECSGGGSVLLFWIEYRDGNEGVEVVCLRAFLPCCEDVVVQRHPDCGAIDMRLRSLPPPGLESCLCAALLPAGFSSPLVAGQ